MTLSITEKRGRQAKTRAEERFVRGSAAASDTKKKVKTPVLNMVYKNNLTWLTSGSSR